MPRVLLILAVVAAAFWVVSIVDCAVQPPHRHRGVNKPAWLVIVIVLPVIGGILWFLIGRTRRGNAPATGPRAPDDDPAFLGSIGNIRDQDERIRRLEEELARLDAEGEDPGAAPGGKAEPDDDARDPRGTIG